MDSKFYNGKCMFAFIDFMFFLTPILIFEIIKRVCFENTLAKIYNSAKDIFAANS